MAVLPCRVRSIEEAERVHMDIRKIEYFIEVAEQLNFNKAASELHISHQALSKQIRLLENELGVKLMERSTTRVTLTEAGSKIYRIFKPIMRELELGYAEARAFAKRRKETLRIGYFNGLSHNRVMAPVVRLLEREAPQLHVDILAADLGAVRRLLEEDSIDLAIYPEFIEYGRDNRTCISLYKRPAKIIVSENHPWYQKEQISAGDIMQGDLLVYENHPVSGEHSVFPELQAARRIPVQNFDSYMGSLWRGETFGVIDDMYSRREGNYKLFDLPEPFHITVDTVAVHKRLHPLKCFLKLLSSVDLDI